MHISNNFVTLHIHLNLNSKFAYEFGIREEFGITEEFGMKELLKGVA